MQKKFQVFVSSTFRDLADERQDAIRSILDLGHIPAGMELFPASDTEQLAYIKKVIDECDYYILIMGGRYGSLDDEGISFTEREYDYAVLTGKVVLAFVHGNSGAIPLGKSDTAPRLVQSLGEFRTKVMSGRLVREWSSREQLESLVVKALVRAIADYPAVGWVRGDVAGSNDLLAQLNELRQRNDQLLQRNRALIAENTPNLENLAGFDEAVTLRFVHSYYFNKKTNYQYENIEFTWGEVFRAIAVRINAPHSTVGISSFLNEHLKEQRGVTRFFRLTDDDHGVVKNQLASMKLISVYIAKTLKDGSLHEFMQLTDKGKATLAELLAVRTTTS